MQVSKVFRWLTPTVLGELGNPSIFELESYSESEGAKGTERMLVVKNGSTLYQFNVFGDVVNSLVDGFGSDSDAWKGKKIRIMVIFKNGKNIRKVEALPI